MSSDMIIKPLASASPTASRIDRPGANPQTDQGFAGIFKGSIGEVNRLHQEADQAVEALAAGRSTDVHNTMIALQKADVSFRLLMQVRNKVVAAYETVMRMQI
jgi:flagellar hook-basal body complex protein FliE